MPESEKRKPKGEDSEVDALLKKMEEIYRGPLSSYRKALSEQEAKGPPPYTGGAVIVHAGPEGEILCPKWSFGTKQKGEEADVVGMSICTKPKCPYWRGYGTEVRRTVMTADKKERKETMLTVECEYPFESYEGRERYEEKMKTLSKALFQKIEPKDEGVDLKEVDDLVEKHNGEEGNSE